jgi:hypothetical protein
MNAAHRYKELIHQAQAPARAGGHILAAANTGGTGDPTAAVWRPGGGQAYALAQSGIRGMAGSDALSGTAPEAGHFAASRPLSAQRVAAAETVNCSADPVGCLLAAAELGVLGRSRLLSTLATGLGSVLRPIIVAARCRSMQISSPTRSVVNRAVGLVNTSSGIQAWGVLATPNWCVTTS